MDAWGNPATILGPEGSLTTFTHDILGRRVSMIDPLGRETEYTFDPLDYPEKIIHPEFTAHPLPAGSTREETFDYDPEGALLRETDRLGLTKTYTYTPRNQVMKGDRTLVKY